MAFLAVVVATALVYAVWVLWVPLLPDNLYLPLLDLGKITGYRWRSAILYLLIVLLLYGLYAVGYQRVRRGQVGLLAIFAAGAVFCFELVWAYPATAVDVFSYVAHGRLLAVHQANPFVVPPDQFPQDPIVSYLAFPDEPSQYGPVWVLLSGAFAALAHGDLLSEVLLYKAAGAVAHIASAALIYAIAGRLGAGAANARASALLYLWNPMLLWEMVANAHNDGMMMLFGLGAVWLYVARFDRLVLAALAAGVLVKAPVVLIGPALFVGLWRRSRARAIESALLALALAVVVYRPFWEGLQTVTALRRTDLFTASLGSVLRMGLEPALGLPLATSIARSVSFAAFGALVVVCVFLAARAWTDLDVLRPAYFMLLGGLLLATTWFQAWYVVWPLALGAAMAEARRHVEVALLSLGGLLQYFVFIYLWVMGLFPSSENLAVQAAAYFAIVGPLLLAVALRATSSRAAAPLQRREAVPQGGSPPGN